MNTIYDRLEHALRHPDRLRLYTVLLQDELCLGELERVFELSPSELERHLEVLEESGLLEHREQNDESFYQARSNPMLEAREWVLRHADELDWHELYRLTRRAKRANLRKPVKQYAPTA